MRVSVLFCVNVLHGFALIFSRPNLMFWNNSIYSLSVLNALYVVTLKYSKGPVFKDNEKLFTVDAVVKNRTTSFKIKILPFSLE